jgi:predicted PurR-regulated permease PerM
VTESQRASRSEIPIVLRDGAAWAWRFVVVAAALYIAVRLAVALRVVLIPIFVAVVLAAVLAPIVERLSRRLPRLLATWATLLGTLVVLSAIGVALAGPISSALDDLAGQTDELVADVEDWLQSGPLDLSDSQVDDLSNRLSERSDGLVSGLLDEPASTVRLAAEVIGGVFLALAALFFGLEDGPDMWRWVLDRIRPVRRTSVDSAGRAAVATLQGWMRGVAITGVVDGMLIGVAMAVLGVPSALSIAVLTFFAAFFPIVGATVAGALAVAIAYTSEGPLIAVILAAVVLAVQQIEGDVLLPVVMRHQVRLHPIVVLVVLGAGAAVAGLVGALLSVPLTAATVAAIAAVRSDGSAETGIIVPGDDEAPG